MNARNEIFVGNLDLDEWMFMVLNSYPEICFEELPAQAGTFVALSTKGNLFEAAHFGKETQIHVPGEIKLGTCWMRMK